MSLGNASSSPPPSSSQEPLFWDKVYIDSENPNGCWLWTGAKAGPKLNYGSAYSRTLRKLFRAHRLAYELLVGPIPAGLSLDHLCRNTLCVNPDHLEAVTQRENVLRGSGPTAQNAHKTHCKHGHEFTPKNTYRPPYAPEFRFCRECRGARR